jgi:hypothetical protein
MGSIGLWRKYLNLPWVTACVAFMLSGAPAAAQDADYVPVARRPRGEVLVKGQEYYRPDLTRGVINDYRDLLGWILQIKFTDAHCDDFEQRMILRWPNMLKMDTDEIAGASKQNAEIRAMPPAQLKATHKQLNEVVLKNLRQMVGGAMMLDNFNVVSEDDRKLAQWLMAIYEEQHPEAVAPMPVMPDVPGVARQKPEPKPEPQPKADAPRDGAAPADKTLAPGETPLKQSSADAMSQVICFLSAKSQGAHYFPPTAEFRGLLARKLAAEYATYSPEQQSAIAQLPAYWSELRANWDRSSAQDQHTTLARWKPMLDGLLMPHDVVRNMPDIDRAAISQMQNEAVETGKRLAILRGQRQIDMNQQLQLQQLERMQKMQDQQIMMMSNIARSAHQVNMRIIDNMGPTRHPWD